MNMHMIKSKPELWYMRPEKVKYETFLQIVKQDCFLFTFFTVFRLLKMKNGMCKSLGTLLDYFLFFFKNMITKAQTQVIYSLGLQ